MRAAALLTLAALVGCAGCHESPRAPIATASIMGGWMAPEVAQLLNQSMSVPHEMLWEVTEERWLAASGNPADSIVEIEGIRQCMADSATAYAVIGAHCSRLDVPTVHTHPRGNCSPSRRDFEMQVKHAHRYDVVWCGTDAAVFYWVDRNPLVVQRLLERQGGRP